MIEENPETIEIRGEKRQIGIKFILFNSEGKLLLLRRNPSKYPELADQWDIPGGRIIPKKENIFDAGQREVSAETNLKIREGSIKFITKQNIPRKGDEVIRLTYTADATGDLQLSSEHTESMWVSLEDARKVDNLNPYIKEALDEIISNK